MRIYRDRRIFLAGVVSAVFCVFVLMPASLMAGDVQPGYVVKAGKVIPAEKLLSMKITVRKAEPLISRELFTYSGAIVDSLPNAGKIVDSPSGGTVFGKNDFIYIVTGKPVVTGMKFYVLEAAEKIIHPVANRFIGYLVRIKGVIEIVGEEGGNKKALVIESFRDINQGDLLMEYMPLSPPVEPVGRRPGSIRGVIVAVTDGRILVASGNIVYLDKGRADGITIGDSFNVITGKTPHIPVGDLQVVRIEERTSVALIRSATGEIATGDSFGN